MDLPTNVWKVDDSEMASVEKYKHLDMCRVSNMRHCLISVTRATSSFPRAKGETETTQHRDSHYTQFFIMDKIKKTTIILNECFKLESWSLIQQNLEITFFH